MNEKSKEIEVKKSEPATVPATTGRNVYLPFLGLRDEVDRVFDRFFNDGFGSLLPAMRRGWESSPFGASLGEMMSAPRADFCESDKDYELAVDLPGLDEKEIEVTVNDGMISISAERKDERDEQQKSYHLTERSYGSIRRSFRLPQGADADKAKATFAKGVLTVRVPKTAEARAKPKKIEVKAA